MNFTRKLNYDEIKALSREEDRLYIQWLEDQQRKERNQERKDWTFEDWAAEAFTFNNFAAARRDFFLKEEKIDELVSKRVGDGDEQFTFFGRQNPHFHNGIVRFLQDQFTCGIMSSARG